MIYICIYIARLWVRDFLAVLKTRWWTSALWSGCCLFDTYLISILNFIIVDIYSLHWVCVHYFCNVTSKTQNVVYILQCRCCMQYVGETQQPFNTRINDRRSDYTCKTDLQVSRHLRSPGYAQALKKLYHHYHRLQRRLVKDRHTCSGKVLDNKSLIFPPSLVSCNSCFRKGLVVLMYLFLLPNTNIEKKNTSVLIIDNLYDDKDYYFSLTNTCRDIRFILHLTEEGY